MSYKVILVEDEPIALQKLKILLTDFNDKITIIGTAENGLEAVEKINSLRPDLIFLDIQMPGLTGFQVLEKLDFLPLIIFTTAYDEYALRAFESNTIDYLLKPISKAKLQKAINKLQTLQDNSKWQNMIKKMLTDIAKPVFRRLAVHLPDRMIFIEPEEIRFFQADNKYTEVHLFQKKYLLSKTLNELEKELSANFVRLHRSNIVNKDHVKEVLKLSSRKWIVKLDDKLQTELPVSRDLQEKLY